MSEQENKGFKFKDNRRFDNDGNERVVQAEQTISAAGSTAESQKTNFTLKENAQAAPEMQEEAGIEFRSFVVSLATQAFMQLGIMPPPEGIPAQVDKEAARQTIEILNMLHIKTKGNLDVEEKELLEEVLHNLRINFLKVV